MRLANRHLAPCDLGNGALARDHHELAGLGTCHVNCGLQFTADDLKSSPQHGLDQHEGDRRSRLISCPRAHLGAKRFERSHRGTVADTQEIGTCT
jgi:hypothetical protein